VTAVVLAGGMSAGFMVILLGCSNAPSRRSTKLLD